MVYRNYHVTYPLKVGPRPFSKAFQLRDLNPYFNFKEDCSEGRISVVEKRCNQIAIKAMIVADDTRVHWWKFRDSFHHAISAIRPTLYAELHTEEYSLAVKDMWPHSRLRGHFILWNAYVIQHIQCAGKALTNLADQCKGTSYDWLRLQVQLCPGQAMGLLVFWRKCYP